MRNNNCINLNNHLNHLNNAINEPNNFHAKLYLKSLIIFYENQMKQKECSSYEILIEYCKMWKAIREFSFIDSNIPAISTKLLERFKTTFHIDSNFSRLNQFIDFEYEFQLNNGFLQFIRAHYTKVPEKAIKLLRGSKTIFENLYGDKSPKKITKNHALIRNIPIFLEIVKLYLNLLYNNLYAIRNREIKNLIHFLTQMKDISKDIDNSYNFRYFNYLLIVENLIHFNIYLKNCRNSIECNKMIQKFQYPLENLPVHYDPNLKILIDYFKVFEAKNLNHLIIFQKKLHHLIDQNSRKIPNLILLQLSFMLKLILSIISINEINNKENQYQEFLSIFNQKILT